MAGSGNRHSLQALSNEVSGRPGFGDEAAFQRWKGNVCFWRSLDSMEYHLR